MGGTNTKEKKSKQRTTTVTIRLSPEDKRKVEEYAFNKRIAIADMMTPAFLQMWGKALGISETE